MTCDQDQVDSFMKSYNWTNFDQKSCHMSNPTTERPQATDTVEDAAHGMTVNFLQRAHFCLTEEVFLRTKKIVSTFPPGDTCRNLKILPPKDIDNKN